MIKIIIAIYNPETDCIEVSLYDEQINISIYSQICNTSFRLYEQSDITYLTMLASECPRLYAILASIDGGLQGYVEAMGEFN